MADNLDLSKRASRRWRARSWAAAALTLLFAFVAATFAACLSSTAPPPAEEASPIPPGMPIPLARHIATPLPSQPGAGERLAVGEPTILAWPFTTEELPGVARTNARVVVPLTNVGSEWLTIDEIESSYTVFDQGGGVLIDGSVDGKFGRALPNPLGPGETAYLMGHNGSVDRRRDDFASADVDVLYEGTQAPVCGLEVHNATISTTATKTVAFAGQVVNNCDRDVFADVIVVFFDNSGAINGVLWGDAPQLSPRQGAEFRIEESWTAGMVDISEIASGAYFAGDLLALIPER